MAKQRDRETSRRWQAHYDLILGRLLAMKIRCYEYNWACAKMMKDAAQVPETRARTPGGSCPTTRSTIVTRRRPRPKEARSLLKRVVDEHPDTPWALLAQRELKDPFGFKWVETYVQPDVRENGRPRPRRRRPCPSPPAKPAELPKL